MTTRVFRARSLIEAREAAVAALGGDAVILTTREVKSPGFRGLLGATEFEVAAASLPRRGEVVTSPRTPFAADAYSTERASPAPTDRASRAAVVNALRADLRSEIRAVRQAMGGQPAKRGGGVEDLAAEVCAIREAVEQLTPQAARGGRLPALLRSRSIEGRSATEVARALKEPSREPLEGRLKEHLRKMVHAAPWPLPARGERVIVAAVGLSGVGKTTTLAKLATHAKTRGHRIAFVTSDTFRVGGVEQLRRYGVLLDCPVDVARNIAELRACIAGSDADMLLVDTSGRPPTEDAAERLLGKEAFEASLPDASFVRHVLLCTPGAGREADVLRTVRTYAGASPTALAITKLDETASPSGMLHAAWATKLPIALVCSGPRVPEDIAIADIQDIVDRIAPTTETTKARAA